jgi:hypothetical protein
VPGRSDDSYEGVRMENGILTKPLTILLTKRDKKGFDKIRSLL